MGGLGKTLAGALTFAEKLILVVRRWTYENWFVFREGRRCRLLELGPGNCFNVPVRNEGVGALTIGSDNVFGFRPAPRFGSGQILLQARRQDSHLLIGSRNVFSNNVSVIATKKISVGDSCKFGDQVCIFDSDFHQIVPYLREATPGPSEPVYIGNNVWLGSRVMVMKGVTIGENTVIGAMSLVITPIPSNCVAGGNPAKVIRHV